jgi:hypothetical protein
MIYLILIIPVFFFVYFLDFHLLKLSRVSTSIVIAIFWPIYIFIELTSLLSIAGKWIMSKVIEIIYKILGV